jgi:hypothetical protein
VETSDSKTEFEVVSQIPPDAKATAMTDAPSKPDHLTDEQNEQRLALRRELLEIIATHQEGFDSGTPESARIDAIIDELEPLTFYPDAMNFPDVFRGHWSGDYYNIGRLIGGKGAHNKGRGVTTSLKVWSMGRLPDIPSQFLGSGLEINPDTGEYNFFSHFTIGEKAVPAYHFAFAKYRTVAEEMDRFFVDFDKFKIVPADHDMTMEEFVEETGLGSMDNVEAKIETPPKLWSRVPYMDDEMRVQLGKLGGHYILFKTDRPMYSIEYWKDKTIAPPSMAAE